ncbi:hypothetical protein [Conservatibacter flavescens]|uniref:Uncharacterized protein n=1 Tax=Conservatibacter flavescens TaxID=28161 RepID=A0A2M8RZJ2_9PAST|nr:hypothetical protein [Conservatibacter flavescens]PJG84299.1 hypothetical protein CVP05_11860 [Conservatibacter flavescens]
MMGLVACRSAPEVVDENTLSPGIMQPVEGTGAVEGTGLIPDIQQGAMPADMR